MGQPACAFPVRIRSAPTCLCLTVTGSTRRPFRSSSSASINTAALGGVLGLPLCAASCGPTAVTWGQRASRSGRPPSGSHCQLADAMPAVGARRPRLLWGDPAKGAGGRAVPTRRCQSAPWRTGSLTLTIVISAYDNMPISGDQAWTLSPKRWYSSVNTQDRRGGGDRV